MLPAAARMRRRADFEEVRQHGRPAGRRLLSGRLLIRPDNDEPARVGFTVSRAVGPAVIRNRVRRRLRRAYPHGRRHSHERRQRDYDQSFHTASFVELAVIRSHRGSR